ncbi:MBL fold metallo-hydrolase [Prevotella sp. KH2C16]|uniref:MBL fold metallo-hydrolase n=1 Tax=Prevotella sp. KH2C16 TaxID=1855325 RepID=UPI0008E437E8|nr:MBL fold metallo-hydrolase [Prevotella sp. KH2C16]SFG17932.1 Glyoxylase, beta-lactamase superfamily II [Prevotella sp. KH2C16]
MEIKAIRMFDHGFMNQAFAFGGEEDKEHFDEQIIYRSSLQNFLIDTGSEVILVDTGFQNGFKAPEKKLGAPLYMGEKMADYMEAFAALGYEPGQVTKILITHKHPDHSAALQYFPQAKVYISSEDADAMKLEGENIVRATYADGPCYNFPRAQKVTEGIWFVEAKGHTKGNSIVIVEADGLFYLIHGDVTYCDAALKANKLSIVFEDIKAARQTLDRVREFVGTHPTVYLSTHCPEGYENLEMKRVMKL